MRRVLSPKLRQAVVWLVCFGWLSGLSTGSKAERICLGWICLLPVHAADVLDFPDVLLLKVNIGYVSIGVSSFWRQLGFVVSMNFTPSSQAGGTW